MHTHLTEQKHNETQKILPLTAEFKHLRLVLKCYFNLVYWGRVHATKEDFLSQVWDSKDKLHIFNK